MKKATTFRITYPITDEERTALSEYPSIQSAFKMPEESRSKFELIRLLQNVHYEHIRNLLRFVDKWIGDSGPIGKGFLQSTNQFEQGQRVAELYLFAQLRELLNRQVIPATFSSDSPKIHDITVKLDGILVKIEVYTPTELASFQLFQELIRQTLRYLDVPFGFKIKMRTSPVKDDAISQLEAMYHPYSIGGL